MRLNNIQIGVTIMKGPKYELIVAAVGGDEEAMRQITQHYEPMIAQESRGNKAVRKHIIAELRKAILNYDLNDTQKNEAYLQAKEAMPSEQ